MIELCLGRNYINRVGDYGFSYSIILNVIWDLEEYNLEYIGKEGFMGKFFYNEIYR